MNIVLIGMMGSGKTTVGRALAESLGRPFYDTDALVEKEEKMSVAEIFKKRGEASFREMERSVIQRVATEEDCVISTGGGAPLNAENWSALSKNSTTVWLKVSPAMILARLEKAEGARPLVEGKKMNLDHVSRLLKEREPHYAKAALTIEADRLKAEQVAERIQRLVFSAGKK